MANGTVAAPFVVKTYCLVDDAATDAIITWGRDNNSFVVVDPFTFSQILLPAHFKHGNFSSFVRQLNTYGFRKVDPDRWEFAHESFLRGQTHLLRSIMRRNCPGAGAGRKKREGEMEGEEEAEKENVATEVVRLRQEQRRIEEQVQGMWQRVQEIERRPRQMLAFLVKVAGDPTVLNHLGAPAAEKADGMEGGEKRARLRASADCHWNINDGSDDVEEGMRVGDNRFLGTIESFGGVCRGGVGWVGNELGGVDSGYQFPESQVLLASSQASQGLSLWRK